MTELDLAKISLGSPAAERDWALKSYFVKSDAYKRVALGNSRILIGNRGVGKSAIFEFIAAESKGKPNTSVIKLSPDDYSYELLSEIMTKESDGSWKKQGAYSVAWKYLLYVLIMKSLAKNATESVGKGDGKKSLSNIRKYLRENHSEGNRGVWDALISYLKRLEGVKIARYEVTAKARELQKLYRLEELHFLMPDLREVLKHHEVIIFVDELDRGWDAGEDAQAFVAGLFQACLEINSLTPKLRLYMSLRQELYENIPALYDDAQKVRDIIETIRWDESGLRTLITQRIRHALVDSHPEGPYAQMGEEDIWSVVYSETLAYRNTRSFNYVVDRTLYRPREIIQFCTQILERGSQDSNTAPLDYPVVVTAESAYSEDRAKDIAAEYRFQYPGLIKIFESFRGKSYLLEDAELENICIEIVLKEEASASGIPWVKDMEASDLIEVLWRVGFLRAQAVGGIKGQQRSGSRYVGVFQVGSLDLSSITRYQVHPMFRSWLALKEPKNKDPK